MIPGAARDESPGLSDVTFVAAAGPAAQAGSAATVGVWAPCLSALCFVHCAGTALLVPFVPALAAFAELAWLEWAMLAASTLSMGWVLWRVRPPRAAWALGSMSIALVVAGLVSEREWATRVGFLVLAFLQGALVLSARRRRLAPVCCESNGRCSGGG